MKKTIFLLGILLGIVTPATAAEPASPQRFPKPELQITIDPHSRPNTFQLSAVNRGKSNLLIIRPRSGMMDRFEGWGGWSIRVQGVDGPFVPLTVPGGIPPFTALDLAELRPGESIGVVLNLDHFVNKKQTALVNLPGKYTIVASYYLEQDRVIGESSDNVVAVPRFQPIESKPLQFVVKKDANHSGQLK